VYILAEIGSTHDGSLGIACNSVKAAAAVGSDGVKFQTHIADAESIRDAPPPPFFDAEPRFDYFTRTGFSEPEWIAVRDSCKAAGVDFLSSPFSVEAVDLLERVGVTKYKIPSGEVTNLPLIKRVVATGKPIFLSSGMSDWKELDLAVETALQGASEVTLLQCTSKYPCPYEDVGLNVLTEFRERYGLPVGLSDHTNTNYAALAAVTLGAVVIEKHFTLSQNLYGSDAEHSIEPDVFRELVQGIRAIETMLATDVDKSDIETFGEMKRVFEKSIVAALNIEAGALITREMLAFKKPGTGMSPAELESVVGAQAARALPVDTLISKADLESPSQ